MISAIRGRPVHDLAQAGVPRRLRLIARAVPMVLALMCLAAVLYQLRALDWAAVGASLRQITVLQWIGAGLATAASFAAMAQYDLIAHRHIDTGIAPRVARRAGASAIAVGQVTGFGPVVGAAVRWRLLPGLSPGSVVAVTGFVTVSFFVGWVALALGWALPAMAGWGGWSVISLAALSLVLGALLLALPMRAGAMRLPSLIAGAQMLALCFCDLAFAALAFCLLLPSGLDLAFWPFAAAFFVALGAGFFGGTPGGLGPFEMALIALVPQVDLAVLTASLLAYRLVYQALPCALAALYLIAARPAATTASRPQPARCSGPRPEFAIAAQARTEALTTLGAGACLLSNPHSLTLFLGPEHGSLQALLPALQARARATSRVALLYKLTGRDAVQARKAGWRILPVAREAVLTPQDFTLDGPDRRQLRRMLRKASGNGVSAAPMARPDWPALARVQAAWLARNGRERGLTMGRYCPAYLSDKPIFGAWKDGKLVAFASFVQSPQGLSLDLMRQSCDAPTGSMHLIICAALHHARALGLLEVSLAAVPHPMLAPRRRRAAKSEGLARFKASFAPRWRDLYAAAPGWSAMVIAAIDLWRGVHWPDPVNPMDCDTEAEIWQGPAAKVPSQETTRLAG